MKINRFNNIKAFTVVELLISSTITVILITSVFGAFVLAKQIYVSSIAQANLQRDAAIILEKIIRGEKEPGGTFRLSEAMAYNIASLSKLEFNGTDNPPPQAPTRWYYLNNAATSILYHHPTAGGTREEVIYTAPQGGGIVLRFWPHPVSSPADSVYTGVVVGIDVAVSSNLFGKTIVGSATTMINIRNHSS